MTTLVRSAVVDLAEVEAALAELDRDRPEAVELLDELYAKREFHRRSAIELAKGAPGWRRVGSAEKPEREPPAPEKAAEHLRKLQHLEKDLSALVLSCNPRDPEKRLMKLRALCETREEEPRTAAENWAKVWRDSFMEAPSGLNSKSNRDKAAFWQDVGPEDAPRAWVGTAVISNTGEISARATQIELKSELRPHIATELVAACVRVWRVEHGRYLSEYCIDDPREFVETIDDGFPSVREAKDLSGSKRPEWLVDEIVRALDSVAADEAAKK